MSWQAALDCRAMGFRMRKSISLAPGVRLNVSKRGVGMSVGAGGVRYSAHSSGRRDGLGTDRNPRRLVPVER